MTDHRIGQQLGEYTLTARVGRTYRGEHVRSGNLVAVSVFEDATFDADLARALVGIRHPNVAAILDVGMADGAVYVVSELVEGTPLAERWQGRVAVPEVVAHARDILRGLAAIHAHRIVHRNLRPSNIVVTDAARVVLVDVGVDAMISRPERDDSVDRPVGLTRYLAPELARANELVDGRADIYALGVMMYEALAGKPLFEGDDLQVLQAHVKKRFARLPFDVPRPLRVIVYKALSKEPADRFEDAEEMRTALSSRRAGSGRSWSLSLPLAAGVLVAGAAGIVIGIRSCDSGPATQTTVSPVSTPAGGTPAPNFKAPPPAPGDPPLRPDQEQMLARFAANISQGIYDTPSLTFLLCNAQLGLSQLRHAADPAVAALMRRMVAMFRAAPGMAHVTCPAGPVPLPVPSPPAPSP